MSQISDFQQIQAQKGANEIQSFFARLTTESQNLAETYEANKQEFPLAVKYLIKNNLYITKITILTPAGRELEKFDTLGQFPQSKLTYEVSSEPFKSAISGERSLSKVYYLDEGSAPYLDLFSPIRGNNRSVIGVVKIQINLNQLKNELADIRFGEHGYVYVVDNEGRLIAHPSDAFVLERPNLTSRKIVLDAIKTNRDTIDNEEYVNEKNVQVIANAVKIPGLNWVIILEQPESEAYGFLFFIQNIFVTTLIGSSLFLLLVAIVLSENLTRPIKKLQKETQQIQKGQIDKIVPIKSGDEIQSLSESISSLIDELLDRESSLERTTTQLESANQRLKNMSKLKDEFVSLASHELRTPMTAVRSYLAMIADPQFGGELNKNQAEYLNNALLSVNRLIQLVNDMLNISRIESGRLALSVKSVDLLQLVDEVKTEVLPRMNELGITFTIEVKESLPPVLADSDKIKEVLINLIGNAMKFTPKGGTITVSFVQKEDMIETTVTDTGSGIDQDDLPKLFQKFNRLSNPSTANKPSGTGLGLYLSKALVQLHKGDIWAASEGVGKGSQFTFSLKIFNEKDFQEFQAKYSQSPDKV